MLKAIWSLILAISFLSTNAQKSKEGNIWYFGENAGIDFNTSPPKALTNGGLNIVEGCASICNKYGNLLFYTDGKKVFNKNHVLMKNGLGLRATISPTQSCIIVPNLKNGNLFYVFTTSGYDSLYYSVIDTTKALGLGEVIEKNTVLMVDGTEKLNAIKHANGIDTWVVTRQRETNLFYAFLIDSSGLNVTPVISQEGGQIKGSSAGQLKISPRGDKLVSIEYSQNVELYDFDAYTGKISNKQILDTTNKYYGAEFSPSGDYLYLSRIAYSFPHNKLEQFYMRAGSLADIKSSKVVLDTNGYLIPGALQLASDGKIYRAYSNVPFIGVINNPDNKGAACNYVENGFGLLSRNSLWGLPNFNQSDFYTTNHDIGFDKPECDKLTFNIFNLGDTASIIKSLWYFGDGTIDSGVKVTKTFSNHNNHTITNIVFTGFYNQILVDTLVTTIRTQPLPKAKIWTAHPLQCLKDNYFEFIDSSIYYLGAKNKSNQWVLGKGSPTFKNVKKTARKFNALGTYNIELIVESTDGCRDTIVKQIEVHNPPHASFSTITDKLQCQSGNKFNFKQESIVDTPETISAYWWNFGDSTFNTSKQPSKVYTDTGTYRIAMATETSHGCTDTAYDTITVFPTPTANFTAPNVCRQDTTKFINQSTTQTTSPLNYLWILDQGIAPDTTINPKYYYSDSGQYTIKLITTNIYNCKDSITKTTRIYPTPQVDFSITGNCTNKNIAFVDKTIRFGNLTYNNYWDLGDGKHSNSLLPFTTVYSSYGKKEISLKVVDKNGCLDSAVKDFYINPQPKVDFTINNNVQCIKNNKFEFTNTSTLAKGSIANLTWLVNGVIASPQETFSQTGNHTIKLIAQSDSGCIDSTNKNITVYPNIKLDITINKTAQCSNQQQFITTNNSTVNGAGNITQYNWIYSDNTTETTKTPQPKKFSKDGDYTLTAILETDKGCKDTLTQTLTVYYSPTPNFETEDICYGDSAYFDNNTPNKDSITNWHWDFGDGTTAATENPYRKYPATGNYQIQLIATTNNGCRDTIENYYPNLVKPQPKAHYQDTLIDSYDRYTTIQFNNQSTDGTDYLWDFGDGTIENTEHPEKVYNEIGQFTVTLTVNNQWGCEDQYQKQIYVVPTTYIFIPSAFTPGDRDTLNAYFRVEGVYFTKEIDMKIFNRWGALIYHSAQPNPKWDGRYQGELVPNGTYLYTVRILDYKNKVHIYSGGVTVIK